MAEADAVVKQIRAALEVDGRINLHAHPLRIVRTERDVVLQGEVDSIAAKKVALARARAADGINVVDQVRVARGERLGDGALRDLFLAALAEKSEFANCTIRYCESGRLETFREARGDVSGDMEVDVRDGIVHLRGTILSPSHKRVAGVIAWWTRGVRDVDNALEIDPPREDNDEEIIEALALVLEMDPAVDEGQLRVQSQDRVVTLLGFVPTEEMRRQAERDAWALDGVVDVVNRIELAS